MGDEEVYDDKPELIRLLNFITMITDKFNQNNVFATNPIKILECIYNNALEYEPFVLYDEIRVADEFVKLVPAVDGMTAWESLSCSIPISRIRMVKQEKTYQTIYR